MKNNKGLGSKKVNNLPAPELNAPMPPWSLKNMGMVIGIIIITITIYGGSLRNQFVYWDDDKYVLEDEHVKSLAPSNILSMFIIPNTIDYRPMVTLSLAVNYIFGGLNPYGYHLTNLLIHLLSVILLYFLILKLSRKHFVASVVSVLFGIHPMNVESVSWITERKDVLYVFFYLLAMLAYIGYWFKDNKKKRLWLTGIFFAGSLCSKGMAITLPITLLLLDYLNGRRVDFKAVKEKKWFFVFAFLLCLFTLGTQSSYITKYHPEPIEKIGYQLFFSTYGMFNYVSKLIYPWQLSAAYPFPEKIHGEYPMKFYWSLVIIPMIPLLLWKIRKNRKIMFGILFLFLNILLPIIVVPFGQTFLGDRFTYLAGIGLFFVGAVLLENYLKKNGKWANYIFIFLLAYFLILAEIARERTKIWENTTTLFKDVVDKFPDNKKVYTLATKNINASGDYKGALEVAAQAIRLPGSSDLSRHIQSALYYYKNNNLDSALWETNLLLKVSGENDYCFRAGATYNRCKIYTKMGKKTEARNDFYESFRLYRVSSSCHSNFSDSGTVRKEIEALP